MSHQNRAGLREVAPREPIPFPSLEWFRHLARAMNENRARQEQLGYVDCVAQFTVVEPECWSVQVAFVEFEAVDVRLAGADDESRADFILEASLATWREMVESIAAGGGRPDLDHSLNRLTHMGEPMRVRSGDPLRRDLYFRYNQSLQEFVNASGAFRTVFRG